MEVGILSTPLVSHPHALRLASLGLGSFHVRQNNDAVKAMLVDVIGGGIEAGTPSHHTLGVVRLTLLPYLYQLLINRGIEGDHSELSQLG